MEKRRRVTEEDLLITEALIADSYIRLKQSVVQAPARAYRSVGRTVREHPLEATIAAAAAGTAGYGIINLVTSYASAKKAQEGPRVTITMEKDTGRQDLMREMLPIIIPLVAPYLSGYIQKFMGEIPSGKRD